MLSKKWSFVVIPFVAVAVSPATARATLSGSQVELSSSPFYSTTSTIHFDTTTVDVDGPSYSTSAGTFIADTAGVHAIKGNLTARSTTGGGRMLLNVLVNGAVATRHQYELPSNNAFTSTPFETLTDLNPGDIVSLQIQPISGTNVQVAGAGRFSHAAINSPGPATSGVQAAITSSTQSYNSTSTVVFDSTSLSSGGPSYSTSTGNFTANSAGVHAVKGNLTARSTAGLGGVVLHVQVNGGTTIRQQYQLPSNGAFTSIPFDALADLNTGDTVSVQIQPFGGTNVEVAGAGGFAHASVTSHGPTTSGFQAGISASSLTYTSTSDVMFDLTLLNTGEFTDSAGAIAATGLEGLHEIHGSLTARSTSGSSGRVVLNVLINGTVTTRQQYELPAGNAYTSLTFGTLANLDPGDIVGLQIQPFSGTTVQIAGAGGFSHVSIMAVAVPEAGAFVSLGAVFCFVLGKRRRTEYSNESWMQRTLSTPLA